MTENIYATLAADFDQTFTDTRGGVELTYITGEQVITRLNEVLGVAGWDFRITQHGYHADADEWWVLGELRFTTGQIDTAGNVVWCVRQQFGSEKTKRRRADNTILDLGFNLKGAATDALKKCATQIGIGLYLSRKEAAESQPAAESSQPARAPQQQPTPIRQQPTHIVQTTCESCGKDLEGVQFKDGTSWSTTQLAGYGRRKYGKVLCMEDYMAAKRAAATNS